MSESEQPAEPASTTEAGEKPKGLEYVIADEFTAGCEAPIADSRKVYCQCFGWLYQKAAQEAEAAGDERAARVYRLLGAVTQIHFKPNDKAEPYGPIFVADGRRSLIPSDLRGAANPSSLFRDAPDGGFIPANTPDAPASPGPTVPPPEKPLSPISERDPYGEAWERYAQEQERLAQQRNLRMLQAIGAPTRVQGIALPKSAPAKSDGGEQRDAAQPQSPSGQFASLLTSEAARQRRLLNGDADEDLNRAAEKRAFLTDREPQTRAANTLAGGREAPLSPYEVKAGTVIPAIMVGGVSSDLPGQLIGQVAENVYDTATGRFILIPQAPSWSAPMTTPSPPARAACSSPGRASSTPMLPRLISARCPAPIKAALPASKTRSTIISGRCSAARF